MKKIIFLSACVLCALFSIGQNTPKGSFKILNNQDPARQEFIETSILNSNMEIFRLMDKDVTLHFENGFDLELVSAKAFFINGGSINPKTYQEESNLDKTKPTFKLTDNGTVVVLHTAKDVKPRNNN